MAAIRVADISRNEGMTSLDEGYGIEVEAENYPFYAQDQLNLAGLWKFVPDGSLRNTGVEMVSRVLAPFEVENAVRILYENTRRKWKPTVRTGIHIHANMLGKTFEDVAKIAAYYAFAEPLLFDQLDKEREQNIYCVPWYRSWGEARIVRSILMDGQIDDLRETTKYSALYAGPLLTFGTIEFRHAQTFDRYEQLMMWWRMCRAISQSDTLASACMIYATSGVEEVLLNLFGDMFPESYYQSMAARAEELGSPEIALMFQPAEYKFGEWGKPGEFAPPEPIVRETEPEPEAGVDPDRYEPIPGRNRGPSLARGTPNRLEQYRLEETAAFERGEGMPPFDVWLNERAAADVVRTTSDRVRAIPPSWFSTSPNFVDMAAPAVAVEETVEVNDNWLEEMEESDESFDEEDE